MRIFILITIFLVSCQQSTQSAAPVPAAAQKTSTGGADAKCLYITNGVQTNQQNFPAVVMVETQEGMCTGTFVAPNAILTAAHCLSKTQTNGGPAQSGLSAVINGSRIPAATAYFRDWAGEENVKPYNDIAVIQFASAVAPAIMPIAAAAPAVGTQFTIVGFGALSTDDQAGETNRASQFYQGSNQIVAMPDDYIISYGESGTNGASSPGQNSSGSFGDSGGPLIVNGTLAGTESWGSSTLTAADFAQTSPFIDEQERPATLQNNLLQTVQQQVLSGRKLSTDYHVNINYPQYVTWLKGLSANGIQVQFASPPATAATTVTNTPTGNPITNPAASTTTSGCNG